MKVLVDENTPNLTLRELLFAMRDDAQSTTEHEPQDHLPEHTLLLATPVCVPL